MKAHKALLEAAIFAAIFSLPIRGFSGVPAAAVRKRGTAVGAMNTANGFRGLPETMTIRVRLIPQREQRYDTEDDWLWNGNVLEIRMSREVSRDDPRYGILLLTHELVEALLCRSRGVSTDQVDRFDMAFKGVGEPGDDPAAPYHQEHEAAQAAEHALANALKVDWRSYLGG